MSSESENEDLQPSKLGTKEYWDNVYEQEITNFDEFGDEGEVWFGQESVEKMVSWVLENIPPPPPSSTLSLSPVTHAKLTTLQPPTKILEIGSGNGNLLFALADAGYNTSYLAGIDYSDDAVRLVRKIASDKARDKRESERGGYEDIVFEKVDFLGVGYVQKGRGRRVLEGIPSVRAESQRDHTGQTDQTEREGDGEGEGGEENEERWTLVLDKGTYDAMALTERDEEGKRPCDSYPERVASLLKPGGFFLITSCNFTKEELLKTFQGTETGLRYHSEIEFPSISFGGVKGSTYCSVAFQKTTTTNATK